MVRTRWLAALLAAAVCVGCGPPLSDFQGGFTGKVEVDGSSTVAPITALASDEFRELYPGINVTVGVTGTGNGFKRFVTGETDISNASRQIKPDEFAACKKHGVAFIEIPIAYDGLTFVTHPDNDWCHELTVEDIRQIFREDGHAKTWQDLHADWPAAEIKIYAPGTGSGTFDYFKEVLGKEISVRPDITTSENDNILVQGVSGDKHALGFFGAAYYFANQDKLQAVAIVNPKTERAVAPNLHTVVSGDYAPYSRPLFIYVNAKSARKPEVRKFVEFYLAHGPKLAEQAEYFPLPEKVYRQADANLDASRGGTHFVTADGKQREGAFLALFQPENLVSF